MPGERGTPPRGRGVENILGPQIVRAVGSANVKQLRPSTHTSQPLEFNRHYHTLTVSRPHNFIAILRRIEPAKGEDSGRQRPDFLVRLGLL